MLFQYSKVVPLNISFQSHRWKLHWTDSANLEKKIVTESTSVKRLRKQTLDWWICGSRWIYIISSHTFKISKYVNVLTLPFKISQKVYENRNPYQPSSNPCHWCMTDWTWKHWSWRWICEEQTCQCALWWIWLIGQTTFIGQVLIGVCMLE